MLPTVMLVVDGPPDVPEDAYDGRSALQCATTPRLDRLARQGRLRGLRHDISEENGETERWLALSGFVAPVPPARGPLEASALEVPLGGRDLVFSAPIATGLPERVDVFATALGAEALAEVGAALDRLWSRRWRWFAEPTTSVLRWTDGAGRRIECRTPAQAAGTALDDMLPEGDGAEEIARLMWDSVDILSRLPGNRRRVGEGLPPWLCIWPHGPGPSWVPPGQVPPGWSAVGSDASFLGLARSVGMRPVPVPLSGNIEEACLRRASEVESRLARGDAVVWVHVCRGATDPDARLAEIESVDRDLIGGVLERLERREARVRWRVAWQGESGPVLLESDPAAPIEGRLPFDGRGFADTRFEVRPSALWVE